MKKLDLAILFLFVIALLLSISNLIYSTEIEPSNSSMAEYGYVVIQITDEQNKPLQCAKVSVIESKTSHTTSKDGYTEKIIVPIIQNKNFDSTLPQDWGEITIIAQANGYAPYVMYNVKVKARQKRVGIILQLREIINEQDKEAKVSTESPDIDYTNKLINLY